MTDRFELPDPFALLAGLLPGNILAGEPPLPRGLIALMEASADSEPDEVRPHFVDANIQTKALARPGCTAAETTILTLGFLEGLSEGMGGFGVLRQGKEYLETGAQAARSLGRTELADDLEQIAEDLAEVHTAEEAQLMAERLRPLKADTWELGRRCKGNFSPEALEQARQLAQRVRDGEITFEQAVKQVKGAGDG